jgi:hypothetical protein
MGEKQAEKATAELKFSVCPGDNGLVVLFTEGKEEIGTFCSESSYIYVAKLSDEGITINFIPVDTDSSFEPINFVVGCEQLGFMATRFNVLQDKLSPAEGQNSTEEVPVHADGHVA